MQNFKKLSFQQLQKKHPEAFFQPLIYSRLKFQGAFANLRFFLSFLALLCLVMPVFIFARSVVYSINGIQDNYTNVDLTLISFISVIIYPLTFWAWFQARYSSQHYARHLQRFLYLLPVICLSLLINCLYLHIENISILAYALLIMTLHNIFIEMHFKQESTALERFKLQKTRQLALWAYKQSKKTNPPAVIGIENLQHYYLELHQHALEEEQALFSKIRYKNVLEQRHKL